MSHAQKPDFLFRRNESVHLNRRGRQFSRLLAAELCASALIVGSNSGYTMFRDSEKGTGCPLHSPVSPSLPLPCVTVCRHISTGVYESHKTHKHKWRKKNAECFGAFVEQLRKVTISRVMSIHPSVCPSAYNIAAPIGRILMNFH
jgi:hypothetical protein